MQDIPLAQKSAIFQRSRDLIAKISEPESIFHYKARKYFAYLETCLKKCQEESVLNPQLAQTQAVSQQISSSSKGVTVGFDRTRQDADKLHSSTKDAPEQCGQETILSGAKRKKPSSPHPTDSVG